MTYEKKMQIEKMIARSIIKSALAKGYVISVFDGEEWTLSRSSKGAAIFAAMMSTDSDALAFWMPGPGQTKSVGLVWLVWGNGCEVITDYSDNDEVAAILAPAEALAEKLEGVTYG